MECMCKGHCCHTDVKSESIISANEHGMMFSFVRKICACGKWLSDELSLAG